MQIEISEMRLKIITVIEKKQYILILNCPALAENRIHKNLSIMVKIHLKVQCVNFSGEVANCTQRSYGGRQDKDVIV